MKSVAIIVPTIREKEINLFLEKWDFPDYCKVYIIEDNPEKKFKLSKNVHFHGSWQDFEEMEDSWIFSKKCGGGIRSYAFYRGWKDGCDYFCSLDDDCLPDTFIIKLYFNNLKDLQAHSDTLEEILQNPNFKKQVSGVGDQGSGEPQNFEQGMSNVEGR